MRGFIGPCVVAVCLAVVPGRAAAQQRAPEASSSSLTIFVRGAAIGTELVNLSRTADGWTITSTGRLGAPLDAVARKIEARYTGTWQPREFTFDGVIRGSAQTLRTVVDGNQAKTDLTIAGQPTQRTETIDPDAVMILPNTFFGTFEAIAARLKTSPEGSTIPAYGVTSVSFSIRVGASTPQRIQTTARVVAATRTQLTLALPGAAIAADLWTDEAGRMIRLSVPAQALEVVREDIASVSSRSITISRPNDEPFKIPANGFILAATLSRPAQAAPPPTTTSTTSRLPAVVLVGGTGPADRDYLAYGVPILGELAGAIADAGYIVVRYDRRGIGQSGGRAETAGLAEYAEDVRAAVKALSDRKDVDGKRIFLVGHSEGGTVALLAASKDKRVRAVGLLATPGVSGADLILAQQQHTLGRSKMSAEEKQAAVDLQRRIHDAVITGKGWEQLPLSIRSTVDNPEFQTLLTNEPGKVIAEVQQPMFILHGTLDTKVDPSNADRLLELAKARKNHPPVDIVKVPGVNHLLERATTGEEDEYGSLPDKHVSNAVTQALIEWLKKTS
jgi:pimeloyl-ACP methyl ester carboxylesterase